MSIEDLIADHLRSGELRQIVTQRAAERTLFIGRDVVELLDREWTEEEEDEERRCGFLEQQLEAFVEGKAIGVCMTPRAANEDAQFAILAPETDGVWDLRSVAPAPGLRVVGMFAKPDVFIGLRWAPRSVPWVNRLPLLQFGSRAWRDTILQASAEWRRLFLAYPPFYVGLNIHDYVTSKANPV